MVADRNDERWWQAEIQRQRGELLRARDPADAAEAEACFVRALETARGQAAKSLELRAAMSMARLWREQGRPRDAVSLLAGVFGWFTEGVQTADLREAEALLPTL